jgi:hypothetical protein
MAFGMPYIHAIYVALTSRNAGSVRTRTVASALYNMCVQAANVIGINVSILPSECIVGSRKDDHLRRSRSIDLTTLLITTGVTPF